MAMKEWENDYSDFLRALYSEYNFSLTCLKKDTSVLLKVINI